MDSHQSPTNDANVPVSRAVADLLNRACVCTTLTAQDVQSHLAIGQDTHPHLFSNTLTFVSEPTAQTIARAVETIDRICQLDAYRQLALSTASSIARTGWGPAGVFMGYDFHVRSHELIRCARSMGKILEVEVLPVSGPQQAKSNE